MLGTEDRLKRNAGRCGEDVNGAATLSIDAGLVGEQADFPLAGASPDGIEV